MKKILYATLFLVLSTVAFSFVNTKEVSAKVKSCKPGRWCVPPMPDPIPADPIVSPLPTPIEP